MLNNNAYGELLGAIGALTTTITIKDGRGDLFPTSFPYLLTIEQLDGTNVIKREVVQVTNKVVDTFTIVRAYEPCPVSDTATTQTQVAQSFTDGSLVQLRLTAKTWNDMVDGFTTNISGLSTTKLDKTTYNAEKIAYASTSTGNDDYVITVPDVASLTDGRTFKVKADVANTGSATLNVNGLGAKTLKKLKDSAFADLENNDIITNQIFYVTYNSSNSGFFQFSVDPAGIVIAENSVTNTYTLGEDMNLGDCFRFGNAENIVTQIIIDEFNSFDSVKWFNQGGYSINSSIYTQTGNGSTYRILYSKNTLFSGDFDVIFRASITTTNLGGHEIGLSTVITSSNHGFISTYDVNGTSTYIKHNGSNVANLTNYHDGSFHIWRIKRVGNIWTYYIDGVQKYTGTGITGDLYFFAENYDSGENLSIDYIYNNIEYENPNYIYKASAIGNYKQDFKGFIKSNGLKLQTRDCNIYNECKLLTFSVGDIGKTLYLSDTPGLISTTPGSNAIVVGKITTTNTFWIEQDRVKQFIELIISPGASPYTYKNTTGRSIMLSITGGTVSQVAYSRDNISFYQTASATNTQLVLGINDYAKITYSGTPTIKAFTL